MPDTVTLVLDAEQYHRELAKVTAGTQRLGTSGERIGDGFLRGDRAVRRATQNITQGLLSTNSVADATLLTFQSLERVFKIPIGATIGAAAAIAGVAALRNEFNKTQEAVDAVRANLRVPLSVEIDLPVADIEKKIDELEKAGAQLEKRAASFGEKVARFFASAASGGLSSGATREREQTDLLVENEKRISDLATGRADKELRIAKSKHDQLEASKESGEFARAEVQFSEKRAQLLDEFIRKGGNMLDIYKRLIAAQFALNDVIVKGVNAAGSLGRQVNAAREATSFFEDVGSGRFAANLERENQRRRDEERGRALISEIEAGQARGFFQDPLSQAELREADRIAARNRPDMSIQELAGTDFTNLLELSKYDFSGLQPLNGLTIQIQ